MKIYNLSKNEVGFLEEFLDYLLIELKIPEKAKHELLVQAIDRHLYDAKGMATTAYFAKAIDGDTYDFGKKYKIVISQRLEQLMKWYARYVLAHEMVHFEQSITNKLWWEEGKGNFWHSLATPIHPSEVTDYKAYRALPWEIDACKRGTRLVIKYYIKKFFKDETA